MSQLEILYEDTDILVCIKPAGVATQTKKNGQQDMESLLKNYRVLKKEEPYIGIVHRLDQPVEGVMVFAKNKKAAAVLSQQIARRQADKYYMALCSNADGSWKKGDRDRIEDYLLKDARTNCSRVVPKGTKGAKVASLSYCVQKVEKGVAFVKIQLETGRHHQIRVQMAHLGHPLIGDRKYGDMQQHGNVALCSCRIRLYHPTSHEKMEFTMVPRAEAFQPFLPRKI